MSEGSYQKVALTVEIVSPEERDKFRALSRPETYHKVRPHEAVGERGAYTVEMTEEEYEQALRDAEDPSSNLIAAEIPGRARSCAVPNQANLDYIGLRNLAEHNYTGSGVIVAVLDGGLSVALRDGLFSGRVAAAEVFTGVGTPYTNTYPHGSQMAGLAVPAASQIAVGKVVDEFNFADTDWIAAGIYWSVDTAGAHVINLSLATTANDTVLSDAVAYASAAGVLVFAAAGNSGTNAVFYPAGHTGAHAISNYDHRTDVKAASSSYGSHIFAAAGGMDHQIYIESGSEASIEDGGTSAATAMSSRTAAYALSSGLTPSQVISQMAASARSTGAGALYEGSGVLELVAPPIPLPTIPPGEDRDFDLIFPEVPAFGGPGSGVDPSGAGGCTPELLDLIEAFTLSGSDADRAALVTYVEDVTGEEFATLLQPEWGQTVSDGVERQKTVSVGGCPVTFTFDATSMVEEATCESLPTYTMTLPVHDFHFDSIIEGTKNFGAFGGFNEWDIEPIYDVHLENPRLVWLHTTDPNFFDGSEHVTWGTGGTGTTETAQEVPAGSGDYYWPTVRISGSITAKIARSHTYNPASAGAAGPHSFTYVIKRPPFALKLLRRSPSGTVGDFMTVDDPVRVGTISTGHVVDTDYPALSLPTQQGTWSPNPFEEFMLPHMPTEALVYRSGSGSAFVPTEFLTVEQTADANAWANFMASVANYNSIRTENDPTLEINQATKTATISFDTAANSLYYRTRGCSVSDNPELDEMFDMISVTWGGYYNHLSAPDPNLVTSPTAIIGGAAAFLVMDDVLERYINGTDDEVGITHTDYQRVVAQEAGTFVTELMAAVTTPGTTPTDGGPPPTQTNPPIVPVGGGCRSSLFTPSSCNWNVPTPTSPDTNFPMPNDFFPDVPVIDTHLPNLPNLPCTVPDFGNFDPCAKGTKRPDGSRAGGRGGGGGPGTMGSLPGGRDWQGNRGSAGAIAGIKTAGQTYTARTYLFTQDTCPGMLTPGIGCMAVIVQFLMDCGIAPVDIIFQVGPEWDKPFPADKCFARGSRIFDAAMWTARFLMLTIVDEGAPTNDVYIGPPWHRPLQTTWTFSEHYDLFGLSRGMSSEEAYGWVEVFGPNVTTPVIVRIDDPFSTVDSPTLRMEVGASYSVTDAQGLAAYKASFVLREAVSVQAIVPYSSEYFLRDLMLLQAPDRGFEETYVVTGKESDVSAAGWFHILTGMLPATLSELAAFPEVTDEYNAVEGGFA